MGQLWYLMLALCLQKNVRHGPYHLGPQELHTVTSSISMIYLRLKYKEIA